MDDRKKYISWMFEPIGLMANGMLLLRGRQDDTLAVKFDCHSRAFAANYKVKRVCSYLHVSLV